MKFIMELFRKDMDLSTSKGGKDMKKGYHHTEMSTKTCNKDGCTTRLKKRLVHNRKPKNITKCYKCHVKAENARGHEMKVV